MGRVFAKIGRACVFGLLGYSIPSLLVALGVPVDEWIDGLGRSLKQPALSFQAAVGGFVVVFTLAVTWLEGKYGLMEKLFRESMPLIKLNDRIAMQFITSVVSGHALMSESATISINDHDSTVEWQRRAVAWNDSVEKLISSSLPPNELVAYRTVAARPDVKQQMPMTLQSMSHRVRELRLMTIRLLPKKYVGRV